MVKKELVYEDMQVFRLGYGAVLAGLMNASWGRTRIRRMIDLDGRVFLGRR